MIFERANTSILPPEPSEPERPKYAPELHRHTRASVCLAKKLASRSASSFYLPPPFRGHNHPQKPAGDWSICASAGLERPSETAARAWLNKTMTSTRTRSGRTGTGIPDSQTLTTPVRPCSAPEDSAITN